LTAANEQAEQMIRLKQETVNTLKNQFLRLKQQGKELYARCTRAEGTLTEEERELHEQWRAVSKEELETEIASVNTRLELMSGGDPNAVHAYRAREAEIQKLQDRLDGMNERIEATQAKIDDLRSKWEPELDEVVARISENFSNHFRMIGCSGQIDVSKEDDFNEWRILIQVSFR
jgi:chromosome segregation ATPase